MVQKVNLEMTEGVQEALSERVISVTSRTAMKAYDVPPGTQFSLEEGGRSGTFVVKSGAPPSDPQEGIYVVLDNGNYAMRRFDGISSEGGVYAVWWGIITGGSEDNSAKIQAAIDYAGSIPIIFPPGETRYTETLNFDLGTKLIGPKGDAGLFAGYSASLNYAPGVAVKTTTASAISPSDTAIDLANASGFPSSGRIYISGINGEWVSYSGKSGNTLTGCTRNVVGGTVGAVTDITGQSYSSGESVWLSRPAIQKVDGAFSGGLYDISLYHDGFVDETTGWTDLGVGLYFPNASYAHVIDNALIYGFEKAGVFGEAYLTTALKPMAYRCRYGFLLTTGNGASLTHVDMGVLGSAASGGGWGIYFKGGNGGSIAFGNLSNGGVNIPVISDSHQELSVSGTYTEATSNDLFYALNDGSIFVKGHYAKGANNLGRIASGGKLFIDGIEHENIVTKRVVASGGETGVWSIINEVDIDSSYEIQPKKYGRDEERYEVPSWNASESGEIYPRLYHTKAITDNTLTDVLKFRTEPDGTTPDITVGANVTYSYGTARDGGQAAEQGLLQVIIKHRINNPPIVSISKVGAAQALDSATLSVTWSTSIALISGNRYETTIKITADESLNNNGELTAIIDSTKPPMRKDDLRFGT